jgi:hypothetical protein
MKIKKTPVGRMSKIAVAAAMLAVPVFSDAEKPKTEASADASLKQKFSGSFHKLGCPCTIAGSDGKHTVYKNAANKYFWMDPATGDQKFVSASTIKQSSMQKSIIQNIK